MKQNLITIFWIVMSCCVLYLAATQDESTQAKSYMAKVDAQNATFSNTSQTIVASTQP